MKKIDVKARPVRGNKDAKVVAVNFDDFQCPYCSRMHQNLFPGLLKEYGDRVQFIYKDFPLVEIHPWAMHAAVDANCLAAQSNEAYWQYADYLHENQKQIGSEKSHEAQFAALDALALKQGQQQNVDAAKLQACIKAQDQTAVKASIHEGESLGVEATPTMFVNGEKSMARSRLKKFARCLTAPCNKPGWPCPHTRRQRRLRQAIDLLFVSNKCASPGSGRLWLPPCGGRIENKTTSLPCTGHRRSRRVADAGSRLRQKGRR